MQDQDQNERISSMIAAGVDPMTALQAVQATDAIAEAKKAVQEREDEAQQYLRDPDPQDDPSRGLPGYDAMVSFRQEVNDYIAQNLGQAKAFADEQYDRQVPGQPSPRTSERFVGFFGRYTVAEVPTEDLQNRRIEIVRAAAARQVRGAVPDSSYVHAVRAIDAALFDRKLDESEAALQADKEADRATWQQEYQPQQTDDGPSDLDQQFYDRGPERLDDDDRSFLQAMADFRNGLWLDPVALLAAVLAALLIFLGSLGADQAQARDWGAYKAISGQQVQIARNDQAAFCHIKGQGTRQLDSRRDTARDCVSGPQKAQPAADKPSSDQEAACKRQGKVWVDPYVRQGSPVSGYCRSYPSDRDSVDQDMGNSLAGNKVVVDISQTRYQSELRAAAAEINRLPGPNVVFSRSNPTLIASDVGCSRDFVGRYEFGPGADSLLFSVCEMRRLPQSEQTGTALHELWHSFGFDHNKDPNSIMYENTDGVEHLGPRDLAEWRAAFGGKGHPTAQPKPAAAPAAPTAAPTGLYRPFPQSAATVAQKRLEALVKKYGDSASYISVTVTQTTYRHKAH